jgi:hypothetical protein
MKRQSIGVEKKKSELIVFPVKLGDWIKYAFIEKPADQG